MRYWMNILIVVLALCVIVGISWIISPDEDVKSVHAGGVSDTEIPDIMSDTVISDFIINDIGYNAEVLLVPHTFKYVLGKVDTLDGGFSIEEVGTFEADSWLLQYKLTRIGE